MMPSKEGGGSSSNTSRIFTIGKSSDYQQGEVNFLDASNASSGETSDSVFDTALDAMKNGDILKFMPGHYIFDTRKDITKEITITGCGRQTELELSAGYTLFLSIQSNNVVIDNLTFVSTATNTTHRLITDSEMQQYDNLHIQNCIFINEMNASSNVKFIDIGSTSQFTHAYIENNKFITANNSNLIFITGVDLGNLYVSHNSYITGYGADCLSIVSALNNVNVNAVDNDFSNGNCLVVAPKVIFINNICGYFEFGNPSNAENYYYIQNNVFKSFTGALTQPEIYCNTNGKLRLFNNSFEGFDEVLLDDSSNNIIVGNISADNITKICNEVGHTGTFTNAVFTYNSAPNLQHNFIEN